MSTTLAIPCQPFTLNDFLRIVIFGVSFCLTTFVYSMAVLPFELMFSEETGIHTCILGAWGSLLSACKSSPPTGTLAPSTIQGQVKEYATCIRSFISNQRLMMKTYEQACPMRELESIEIKPHSNGIEEQGRFRKEYQQQTINGAPVANVIDLYEAADQARETFRAFLSRVAADVMRPESKTTIFMAYMKPKARALEKAQNEYSRRQPGPGVSWVFDVVRASILCTSVHEIIALDNWLHVHAHIVQGKNRFKNPSFTGYRDLLYHIRMRPNDQFYHICEIQVHLQPLWEFSKRSQLQDCYTKFRSYMVESTGTNTEQQRDLDSIARVGFLGESYVENAIKSGGIERLTKLAMLLEDKLGEPDVALRLWNLLIDRAGSKNVDIRAETEATIYSKIGNLQKNKGNLDVAEEMNRRAFALRQTLVGPTHPDTAHSRNDLGMVFSKRGMRQEALVELREALNIWKHCADTCQLELAVSWNNMGLVLMSGNQLQAAVEAFRSALSIWLAEVGDEHPDTAVTYCNIGRALRIQGDFEGAYQAFRKSTTIRESVLGNDHLDTAESYRHLGLLLKDNAQYDKSLIMLHKALKIQLRVFGNNHPGIAETFNDVGLVCSQLGKADEAIVNFRNALEVSNNLRGECHRATCAKYHLNLGTCLLEQGNFASALDEFQTSLAVFAAAVRKDHAEVATCHNSIGTAKWKTGKVDEALEAFEKAIEMRERLFGSDHESVASCLYDKGCVSWEQGNLDEALNSLLRARQIRESLLGKLHKDTIDVNKNICSVLWQKRDFESLVGELKQQVDNYNEVSNKRAHDQAVAALYKGMGVALNEKGDFEAALGAFQQALVLRESALGTYHPLTADSYANMGVVLNRKGDLEESLKNFQQALAIRLKVLGKRHQDTVAARASVNTLANKLKA